VRTSATLRSDRAFEVGNRVAGPAVVSGGAAGVAGGLLAMAVPDDAAVSCVLLGALAMLALVVVGGLRGHRGAGR
jgi:hypothetical protein